MLEPFAGAALADADDSADAEGALVEALAAGALVDAAGWFAEAEAAGWLAEADFSVLDWPAAIAEPAAIRAATRASFLNFMGVFLSSSYTGNGKNTGYSRAVPFGARNAGKLHGATAPSDARCFRLPHRGAAT